MILELNTRGCSKSELAHLYCPKKTYFAALKTLRKWLRYNPQLMNELSATGYHPNSHDFTPAQVEIIYRHLGVP